MSRSRKVALIGGAGFIGHHLAAELVNAGHEVVVIDSLQVNNLLSLDPGQRKDPQRELHVRMLDQRLDRLADADIPLVIQDARDYHALGRLLEQHQPDVIFHAAAVSHAGRSNKDPFTTFDHSLRTLENALDYARDNVEQFIFFSSSMVYGDFQTDPVDETHLLDPIGIYGALKLAGEKLVIAYKQVFDLDYTIVRPSALYGPRCVSKRVGQVFIEKALLGDPLRVAGDGSDRLDFTHIDDLVQGLRLVMESPNARNEIFNITYGESRSIADMLAILEEHFPGLELEREPRDDLMPHRGALGVEKARRLIGYAPSNPLELGFPRYIEWYRTLVPEVV